MIVEVTGARRDKPAKVWTAAERWVPAVNALTASRGFGRWDFLELAGQTQVADFRNILLKWLDAPADSKPRVCADVWSLRREIEATDGPLTEDFELPERKSGKPAITSESTDGMKTPEPSSVENVGRRILLIREQRVILDVDLAQLYGVPTFRFNEAFKRNRDRFPADFAFQLTPAEFATQVSELLRVKGNSSQSAMSSRKHRGATYRPWAFNEHGALMAANILHSPRARQMSIFVIRAFVKMREELAANAAILKRLAEIDRTLLVHDSALRDVYRKLLPLLEPAPEPTKPKIGFHPGDR